MIKRTISIDDLIDIVAQGGKVKTGIDVYNKTGTLLLGKEILVDKVKILKIIKKNGIGSIPLSTESGSGIWNSDGTFYQIESDGTLDIHQQLKATKKRVPSPPSASLEIEKRLNEIQELKIVAVRKYNTAKESIKKVIGDIRKTGGQFDYNEVEASVSELVDFLIEMDNPFSYLTREIFSYDDYLYNHSVNVCTIATAVLNRFSINFSKVLTDLSDTMLATCLEGIPFKKQGFTPDTIKEISIGFFLHDIGKVVIPDSVLNKTGRLTDSEFDLVKRHSFELGISILQKNHLNSPCIRTIVKYHHAALFQDETRCYPQERMPEELPLYVKMCKLADIYDAMTSKRSYKEAFNPIGVVTDIFKKYSKKDTLLQYVLHAFVKSIGIYPPGSIVYLKNGQMAYVLESKGPLVLPFTDASGFTLSEKSNPIDVSDSTIDDFSKVDNLRSVKKPLEVYGLLPSYLKTAEQPSQ